MALSLVQDAAFPTGAALQPGVIVSAGYIGGDAIHVWTATDWAHWGTRYRVPIWVRSDPQNVDPTTDGQACLAALQAVGAPPPYLVLPYGSSSTIFQNPQVDGYWVAFYDGIPELTGAPGEVAKQFQNTPTYDLSVIDQAVPTWDTHTGRGPTAVMLDLETAVDPPWVTTFASVIHAVPGPLPTEVDMSLAIVRPARTETPPGEAWPGEFWTDGKTLTHINNSVELDWLISVGVLRFEITWSQYVALGGS
jgi:hypothetical protein